LLAHLSPKHEAATQTSAGDFLKAIITISANATAQDTNVIGPNELTRQLVSEECIEMLINDMLRGGNPLTVGVGIVIEVIRKNNSDYDLDNQIGPVPKTSDPIYLGTLLREFAKNVPKFMELITHSSQKKELKVAFGDKIEPLGFDRFKTCELMAELLHCSNMALLNERGSEAEVKRRDAERDRLKAEGKLTAGKDTSDANDFGTSVDSQGFHHARAPSSSSGESPEEIRRLEVSNNGEDEFENVTASEALVDEMKDDFDEKDELVGEPSERSPKVHPQNVPEKSDLEVAPLSPRKTVASPAHSRSGSKNAVEANPAADADSPTSAGVTEKLGAVGLDKDAVMKDSPPRDATESDTTSDTSGIPTPPSTSDGRELSPHPDDKPAPLFAKKRPQSPEKGSDSSESHPAPDSTTSEATTTEADTTEEGRALTSEPPDHEDEVPPYEVDLDGAPVVGDLLKMMFVDHQVVPTILVSFLSFLLLQNISYATIGFLLSIPME
jgi:SIT4-associating protein SAP185/190